MRLNFTHLVNTFNQRTSTHVEREHIVRARIKILSESAVGGVLVKSLSLCNHNRICNKYGTALRVAMVIHAKPPSPFGCSTLLPQWG